MTDLVAKRYVKALLKDSDSSKISSISSEISTIASAYSSEKFVSIISSSEVSIKDKENLILSFVENCSQTIVNLIKLLSANKRLEIIPAIAAELKAELSRVNNSYEGVVYTNKELSGEYVSSIEEKFSQKLGVKLKLTQDVCDYNGIKVDIDSLGVEIGFSKDRLKSQMIDHILKAV